MEDEFEALKPAGVGPEMDRWNVEDLQAYIDKMKAETKVRLAKIQQESAVTVQNIIADGQLEVAKLEQQKMAVLTEMKAKAQAEAQKMKSETDVFEEERLSEARLQATRNVAQISESMAKAEGVAAPYVEARKQFETRHKQMKIWEKLAANKDLVVKNMPLKDCEIHASWASRASSVPTERASPRPGFPHIRSRKAVT